jgi:hypothetical protein
MRASLLLLEAYLPFCSKFSTQLRSKFRAEPSGGTLVVKLILGMWLVPYFCSTLKAARRKAMASVKLSEKQLEGLDLLIAGKKYNPQFIDWNIVLQVTVDVVTVTVGETAASSINFEEVKKQLGQVKNMSVDQLLKIRQEAGGR